MQKRISIPPPEPSRSYGPSELFRFFFRLGRWTEESFSSDFQTYTGGILISSVTVNKWKNHNVIPTRYAGQFFKLVQDVCEPAVAGKWVEAFELVWATHSALAGDLKENRTEDFHDERLPDKICDQHGLWIRTIYEEGLFGEDFSARDIYVPIQLVERQGSDFIRYDMVDILKLFLPKKEPADQPDWILIAGDAGSGKSMSALHLAQTLSKTDTMPIYLRGQYFSDIDIDIRDAGTLIIDSFSAKSFLKHFRASSKKSACLILDGVDEISRPDQDIVKILSDFQLEQNVCRAHGKELFIVLSARPAGIDFIQSQTTNQNSRRLEILGLDGRLGNSEDAEDYNVGEDLRTSWWSRYLAAIGRHAEDTPPDFLALDYADFQEFGAMPLWAYLICRTALTRETDKNLSAHQAVNKFTYSQNKNIIYREILSHISTGSLSESHRKTIKKSTDGKLSHYLASVEITDQFIELIESQDDEEKFDCALKNWADISGRQAHDPVLADFCQNEAGLRYADLHDLDWDSALSVIKDDLNTKHYPATGLSSVSDVLSSAGLLFFIWSCFNLVRYKTTRAPYQFSEDPYAFKTSTLKQFQSAGSSDLQGRSILDTRLGESSFLTPSLSALHLTDSDLSRLSFSLGHMDSFSCENSGFAMTFWSHVKISGSDFRKSAFQQAIFHSCRWHESKFSSCLFQGVKIQNSTFLNCDLSEVFFSQCHFDDVRFLSSSYENVIFDRCVFTNCSFESSAKNAPIQGVEFRYSTFLSMGKYLRKFPPERLIDCISRPAAQSSNLLIVKMFET